MELGRENWGLGVFGDGEFEYHISFGIGLKTGLQTGSKMKILVDFDENWYFRVKLDEESENDNGFEIGLKRGLQTGSKLVKI